MTSDDSDGFVVRTALGNGVVSQIDSIRQPAELSVLPSVAKRGRERLCIMMNCVGPRDVALDTFPE